MFRVGLHFLVFLGNVYRSTLVPQTPVHVIGHYSAIFIHIENLVQHLHIQKPDKREILECSEPFYNCIPTYIPNHVIFTKTYEYLE